jgi:hypothetical protein
VPPIRVTNPKRVFPPLLSPFALRVAGAPPAPLSLSFGGLAGRSDWERGGRSLCAACSLVFLLVLTVGAVSPGGEPPLGLGLGGGAVASILQVDWAWCPCQLGKIRKLPSPLNKLKAPARSRSRSCGSSEFFRLSFAAFGEIPCFPSGRPWRRGDGK